MSSPHQFSGAVSGGPVVHATPATVKTTSGKAVGALVCAIIGLFFVGVILGPIAICLAMSAKDEIKARPNELEGECMATAGLAMGVIATVVSIILIIVVVGS